MNLLRYLWAASWRHPHFGIRIVRGKVVGTHGKVNPSFLKELKTLKAVKNISQGWIMGVSKGKGESLVLSSEFSENTAQRLRNLFISTRY